MAPLDDEVFNAVYVEGDDGFLAFVRFQEGQGELVVHETVLGEDCGGVGVLEEVEGGLEVGITVGEVGPDLVTGKVFPCGFVQAGGQFVGEGVAKVGVAAPAGGVVPAFAVAGGIYVDANDDGFLYGVANLASEVVGPAYAFFEGDVLFFGDQEFGIDASELEVFYNCSCNLAVVLVLPEASVGRAFARGVLQRCFST